MGFSFDDAAKIAMPAYGGTSLLLDAMGGGETTSQMPMMTPQQKAAQDALLSFIQTGKFGDFTAGAEVPLKYGDYRTTGLEDQGLSSLQDLLRNGIPEQYRLGDSALKDILDTSPGAMEAQFQPFKDATERNMREAEAGLKRGASYAGNLYSTDTVRNLGDLRARGNETLSSEMARLTDSALNRRLAAVPLAMQSAQAQEGAALNRVAATQTYGDLTRRLNDESIKARDAELLRRRSELQLPIQAATNLAGMNVPYGVPSVTTSPYEELLQMVGSIGGTALGAYMGGPAGAMVGNKVGSSIGRTAGGWSSNGGAYAGNI